MRAFSPKEEPVREVDLFHVQPIRTSVREAIDAVLGKTVMFPNTWQLSLVSVTAEVTRYGSGCGATTLQLDPLPGTRPILGAAQFVDITNIPFGLEFMAYGGSNTSMNGTPTSTNRRAMSTPSANRPVPYLLLLASPEMSNAFASRDCISLTARS